MLGIFNEIRQTIACNKMRTLLTGIAVTWGVFMLIVLLGIARGVTNGFNENLAGRNMARIVVYGGVTSLPWQGHREGRRIVLERSDLRSVGERNPYYVAGQTATLSGGGTVRSVHGRVNQRYSGVFPSAMSNDKLGTLERGRFITEADMKERAKVMVLPEVYAKQLVPPEGDEALGGRVECNGLSFKVVGVYQSRWHRDVYIPYTTASMMAGDAGEYDNMTLELRNVHTMEDGLEAEKNVRNTLAGIHDFDPDDDNAVFIGNYFTNSLQALSALKILDTSVWVLGILTLLTGMVGISNIMFVTVRERRHEIGVRRAVGARPGQILMQIVSESVVITVAFGYVGIVLGMIVTGLIAKVVDDDILSNPTVSLAIAAEVTGVLVLSGAVAGLFPALKALKVRPVEALWDE